MNFGKLVQALLLIKPYPAQTSDVPPAYRDGFNYCCRMIELAIQSVASEEAEWHHPADRRPLSRRMSPISAPPILVDRKTAAAALALSISTFEREVALGRLPKPRKLSSARVGWLWSELLACASGLPISDLPPPENTGAPKSKRKTIPGKSEGFDE